VTRKVIHHAEVVQLCAPARDQCHPGTPAQRSATWGPLTGAPSQEQTRGWGLGTGKSGECKCCDGDCCDRHHGSNEPHFPRSSQLEPSE
jgi:hypothetical protein